MKRLIVSMLMTACGAPELDTTIDPALAPDVQAFYAAINDQGVQTHHVDSILRGTFERPTQLGICIVSKTCTFGVCDTQREVWIADGLEGEELRATIYHELVHCALDYSTHDQYGLMAPYMYPSNKTADEQLAEFID